MSGPNPNLYILAGPNGAGKSTTARTLLFEHLSVAQFVNADSIATGLSPFAPESTAIEAGKLMLKRMRELHDRRESFGFETTLAGKRHQVFIQRARDAGYEVHLIYIWLSSPQLAIARVAHRVRLGGHSVPDETVKRRYYRGLANFFGLYRPLATTWTLCDNSSIRIVIVAQGSSVGETEVYDPATLYQVERSSEYVHE